MKQTIILSILFLFLTASFSTAYTVVEENPVTADGIVLSIKHFRNEGAQPIILQHGVVQNSNCWDMPISGHSFAVYLANLGYDVWVPNFRGHGQDGYVSDSSSGNNWTIDDFAVYDVPAIIDYVLETTNIKPLWVGHSMGGMTIYSYLMGAEYQWQVIDNEWDWSCFCYQDVYGWRIGLNPQLKQERNTNKLAGVITVNAPPAMKWKYDVTLLNFWNYNFWDYNLLVTTLAKTDSVRDALKALDPIPLQDIVDFVTGDIRDIPYVGDSLADLLEWTFNNVGASYIGSQFWNPDDVTTEDVDAVIEHTLDDTSSNVILQFMDSVNQGNFQEFDYQDPERAPFVYSDHYNEITIPILVTSAERDKMACNDTVYNDGYKKLSSSDKSYHNFDGFGHDDVCFGINAPTEVFPYLTNWLDLHTESTSTVKAN